MAEFTTDELHRHIQLTVFGRTRQSHERYNQLQDKLHELVDRPSDAAIVHDFIERVEGRVGQYTAMSADRWYQRYHDAVQKELAAMRNK